MNTGDQCFVMSLMLSEKTTCPESLPPPTIAEIPTKVMVVYLESGSQLDLDRNKHRDHSYGSALLCANRKLCCEDCA